MKINVKLSHELLIDLSQKKHRGLFVSMNSGSTTEMKCPCLFRFNLWYILSGAEANKESCRLYLELKQEDILFDKDASEAERAPSITECMALKHTNLKVLTEHFILIM